MLKNLSVKTLTLAAALLGTTFMNPSFAMELQEETEKSPGLVLKPLLQGVALQILMDPNLSAEKHAPKCAPERAYFIDNDLRLVSTHWRDLIDSNTSKNINALLEGKIIYMNFKGQSYPSSTWEFLYSGILPSKQEIEQEVANNKIIIKNCERLVFRCPYTYYRTDHHLTVSGVIGAFFLDGPKKAKITLDLSSPSFKKTPSHKSRRDEFETIPQRYEWGLGEWF